MNVKLYQYLFKMKTVERQVLIILCILYTLDTVKSSRHTNNPVSLFNDYGFTKDIRQSSQTAFKDELKNRRNSYYPKDSINDILVKDGIDHPAIEAILPIFEKLISGESINQFYDAEVGSTEKFSEDKIAVIRTVSPSAMKLQNENKVRLYFNMTTATKESSKIRLNLNVKKICETSGTTFQKIKLTCITRNSNWKIISRQQFLLPYKNLCKGNSHTSIESFKLLDNIALDTISGSGSSTTEIVLSLRWSRRNKYNIQSDTLINNNVLLNLAQRMTILVFSTEQTSLFKDSSSEFNKMNHPKVLSSSPQNLLRGTQLYKFNPYHQSNLKNSNEKKHKRTKRHSSRKGSKGQCQKKEFIVDFETIGWAKWIVFPKAFNAFYCDGKCPSPVDHQFKPTNHALLQSIMRIYERGIPRPCCSPTKLLPLSMLYYEHGELVVRHHEDMIAETCGCR